MKYIWITGGSIFILLGCIGLIVPGLPVTPFLLLSAAFYLRGSRKLYNRLLKNRFLGKFITDFRQKQGMTLAAKLTSITLMWAMIILSLLITRSLWLLIILPAAGCIGTIVMGLVIRTAEREKK